MDEPEGTISWAKFRDDPHLSWHIVDSGEERVLCGRVLEGEPETSDHLPMHEKSCELCLRLHEHCLPEHAALA